jgi:hypothetical protein
MTEIIINPGPPAPRPPRRLKAWARVPVLIAFTATVGSMLVLMFIPRPRLDIFIVGVVSTLALLLLSTLGREKS